MKKMLCVMLVAMMLLGTFGTVVMAEDYTGIFLSISGDVKVGQTATITAYTETITKETQSHAAPVALSGVTYTSADPSIATVDASTGVVTGVKPGVTTISAAHTSINSSYAPVGLVIVVTPQGAETTIDYESDEYAVGTHTQSTNSQQAPSVYLDLPYEITSSPALGNKALYLTSLDPTDYSDKGLAANSANWMEHVLFDELDHSIVGGKITEFWWHMTPYNTRNWYMSFYLPTGDNYRLKHHNTAANYPDNLLALSKWRGDDVFTGGFNSGYGAGTIAVNQTWNQIVIDGSKADPVTNIGVFDLYYNGVLLGSWNNTADTSAYGWGWIRFNRDLNTSTNAATGLGYFDNFKMYELPEAVSNTVSVGENGSVTFAGTECVTGTTTVDDLTSGGTAEFTVIPENGYEVDTITYNGSAFEADATSVTVVKDATLSVTFKKAGATYEKIADGTYYNMATAGDVKIGQRTELMLLEEVVTSGKAAVTKKSGVTFTSSDTSVAEIVTENGLTYIVGKKAGLATVKAEAFNPNSGSDFRRMKVVVSNGAYSTANYDNETEGSYTESTSSGGNYTLPYSYVTYPRRGLTGLSYSIDPLRAAKASSYGSVDLFDTSKGDLITIEPGKITEFWMMNGTLTDPLYRMFDYVFPDVARLKIDNYGSNSHTWGSTAHGTPAGTFVYSKEATDDLMGGGLTWNNLPGRWNQIVIDGSQVDPETGAGTYTVYHDGGQTFTYTAKSKAITGFVSFLRSLNVSSGVDSHYFFVDDVKMYELPETATNTISVGDGGKVTIDGTDYTGTSNTYSEKYEGETLNFTVTPDKNKVIDKITYNGSELVNTMTSVTVVKDAALSITFKDDPAMSTPAVELWTKTVTPGTLSGFSTHTVYGTITGWKNIEGYGMKLSDGTNNAMLKGFMEGDAWTWLDESEGRFAFRVYGEGIVGKTCTMTPYITVDGAETYGDESDEFTGSMTE